MRDILGNDIQAGDIIVTTVRSFNQIRVGVNYAISIGRVANLTEKGLAYQALAGSGTKRSYAYATQGVGLISSAHRGETLEACRAAFRVHRSRKREANTLVDGAYNRIDKDALVGFAASKNESLLIGQVTGTVLSYAPNARERYHVQVQLLGSDQLFTRSLNEIAMLQTQYEGIHPGLVRELLATF